MAASRARWLVTASRTERGGKAAPALLKWTTLATPGVSDLSDGTSSVMTASSSSHRLLLAMRWRSAPLRCGRRLSDPLLLRSCQALAEGYERGGKPRSDPPRPP